MVENLWRQVRVRNKIMEIAEEIAPLYKSRRITKSGGMIRFISVKDIEFTYQDLGDIVQYFVEIEFLTDQGAWIQPLIVKEFFSEHLFNAEIDYYHKLEMNCLLVKNINLLQILKIEVDNNRIIYEGSKEQLLTELEISDQLKYFQMGTLLSILHGYEPKKIDGETIKRTISYLLKHLPFNDYNQDIIQDYLKYHYEILTNSISGYSSATVFDLNSIWCKPLQKIDLINKTVISEMEAFEFELLIFQPKDEIQDRMMDFAIIFAEDAFYEYQSTQSIDKTLAKMYEFLEGYDYQFSKISKLHLEDLYHNGLTLDIHMLLIFWLMMLDKFNSKIDENMRQRYITDLIDYSYFILISRPFKLYSRQAVVNDSTN